MTNIAPHQGLLTYDDWNNCLFRATFAVEPNEPNARDPVTHIDTSDEFLFTAAARYAPDVSQEELLKRFETLVGGALRSESIDAGVEWTVNNHGVPGIYAVLFYLCRVASMQDGFESKGFYDKLSEQTGSTHSGATRLAATWEELQQWLSRRQGYRPLELPTYPTFRQIGTTLGLTFPRGRDATALRKLLGSNPELSLATLSFESVRNLFRTKGTLLQFTLGFRSVLEDFEKAVDSDTEQMAKRIRHPFWRAVLAAQRELESASPEGTVGFAIHEPEEDDAQAFLMAREGDAIGKYTFEPCPAVLKEGEGYLLWEGNPDAPVREVFAGKHPDSSFARLWRATRTRVLPLTGAFIHDPGKRFPRLLRWDPGVALSLADAVLFRGNPPEGIEPTEFKVGGLEGWRLGASLGKASVSGPIPDAFLLRLRGGIRAGRGEYLAAQGFLPEVIVPNAVTVELVGDTPAKKEKEGVWRFVREPKPEPGTLRAMLSDGRILEQAVSFIRAAHSGSYGEPSGKSGFVEWGGPQAPSEHRSYCVDVRQREAGNESWDGSMRAEVSKRTVAFDAQSSDRIYFGLAKGVFTRSQRAGFPLCFDLLELRAGTPRMSWSREYATPAPASPHLVKDEKLKNLWHGLVDRAREQGVIPESHVSAFAKVRKPSSRAVCVHVEPELPRRTFKQPRRQQVPPDTGAQQVQPSTPRTLLAVLDAVAKNRKSGLTERELLELCGSSLRNGTVAEQWHLVHALCESALLTPHHNGQWSGRSYYAVKPHLRLHRASVGWIATLAGLTDAATRGRVAGELKRNGGTAMPELMSGDGSIQVPRWRFQELETVLSAGEQLGLGGAWFVPRVEDVTEQLLELVRRIPPARQPDAIPRAQRLRCLDWSQGTFSRTRRGEQDVELWRVVRHAQADEYVLEQRGKPVASFFSRTVAILAAHAVRGEPPWASEGRDLRMKPGRYLPLPLARILAFSGDSLPGSDSGSYFYHFTSEVLLRAVTARLGFATGADR
ncbi:hypothetical protein [Myxococcus sp. NMCA1]|uniref:hypothetical protein n=1 Tax=Myxococcus sp. NMCA1 TaxID=2996785 RepID=UPI002285546F|nr:hypothetical protein [Myxococcus sp. NMCA1]WAM30242.1 hypothetical protein OZ403_19765 [Myxococcus sp. NMCA1]